MERSSGLEWLPEELPFPTVVNVFTHDTSKFAEAHARLIQLGLIPKPLMGNSRPLEDIAQNPNLGWQAENCLVYPVPGKENMAPRDSLGWGIYRVVFRNRPLVDFKYCFRHTPGEDFEKNHVLETNPMGQHLREILQILNPVSIVDQEGRALKIE